MVRAKPKPTRRPPASEPTQRVNVDFPLDLLAAIDADAERMGVTRQAWIKIRLADYLDKRDQACAAERRIKPS